jgi:hypothetical protein
MTPRTQLILFLLVGVLTLTTYTAQAQRVCICTSYDDQGRCKPCDLRINKSQRFLVR